MKISVKSTLDKQKNYYELAEADDAKALSNYLNLIKIIQTTPKTDLDSKNLRTDNLQKE